MTSLASLDVGHDLVAMAQVAAAISSASTNPERLSAKAVEAGIEFANKMASSLYNSSSASNDQISDIGTSLLGSVGGAMVSTAKTSYSSEEKTSEQTESTGDAPETPKEVSPEDKTKLEQQASKVASTMFQLGTAILDKKVPGNYLIQLL